MPKGYFFMKSQATSRLIASTAVAAVLTWGLSAVAHAQVGMRNIKVGDMTVTLIYPTATLGQTLQMGPFSIDVALNADVSPTALPRQRRLVVLSHGTGASPVTDHALAERLALAGFVVAQPLHVGDNYTDMRDMGPVSFARRPGEVSQIIDALAIDARWSPVLNLDKVAVHGMSAGGVTALSLAGAQWRTVDLLRHCQQFGELDPGFCYQGATTPQARATRQASFAANPDLPDSALPPAVTQVHGGRSPAEALPNTTFDARPDPRIASITLAVPVAAIFSAQSLARIRVPVGVVSASQDWVLLPKYHSSHVLAHCQSCKTLIDFKGAHYDVLWPWPEVIAKTVAATQLRGGEPTPGFDPQVRAAAHDRIVAFHQANLN